MKVPEEHCRHCRGEACPAFAGTHQAGLKLYRACRSRECVQLHVH